jgi:hypothetical protein
MTELLRAIEPSTYGPQPFGKWEIHDLVHLEDDLLETYGRDFSHDGSHLGTWVRETLDEIARLLDSCGIPRLANYGRVVGVFPGMIPADLVGDDRVDTERVREALEAFAAAIGRADG